MMVTTLAAAVITATAKNTEITGTFNVAVTPAPVAAVESVAVTAAGDATGAEIGGTLQLSASVLPANAAQSVTWASSDDGSDLIEFAASILDAGLAILVMVGKKKFDAGAAGFNCHWG